MWKWIEGFFKADEGLGAAELSALNARIDALEAALTEFKQTADTLVSLPLQWATTTQQLRRMVGHITKTNAIDALAQANGSKENSPRQLSQDDVIGMLKT